MRSAAFVALDVEAANLRIHGSQLRMIEGTATANAADENVASATRCGESEEPGCCPVHGWPVWAKSRTRVNRVAAEPAEFRFIPGAPSNPALDLTALARRRSTP